MLSFDNILKTNFERALLYLVGIAKSELKAQGHRLTGNLERSLQYEVEKKLNTITGKIYIAEYGVILDKGVKPSRIPYSKGSGAKTSEYIAGLTRFFELRGLDFKEAKGAAFATAYKQKIAREGMPTRNSYTFSSNGRRLDWSRQVTNQGNINDALKLLNLALWVRSVVENAITPQSITTNR